VVVRGGAAKVVERVMWTYDDAQTAANTRLTPMNMMDTLDRTGQHLDRTGNRARDDGGEIARLADPNGHVGQDNPPISLEGKK